VCSAYGAVAVLRAAGAAAARAGARGCADMPARTAARNTVSHRDPRDIGTAEKKGEHSRHNQ
jgi:hypothetical protein